MEIYENEDELYHHGIKGQHWGIRRFQNSDGSLTPAGKKRYMKDAKFRAKVDRNKQIAEAKKREKEETAAERHARLLKTSDANELYKHKSELTTEEIRERINRIQVEQQLAQYVKKEPSKIDKISKKVDKMMSVANKVAAFADSKAGKMAIAAVKKQLGVNDQPTKVTNYKEFLNNINRKSNKEVKEMLQRVKDEKTMRETIAKLDEMLNPSSNSNNNSGNNNSNNNNSNNNPPRRRPPSTLSRRRYSGGRP